MSHVAVVGAAGFIGRAMTERTRKNGVTTVLFTRASPSVTETGHLAHALSNVNTVYWLASRINPLIAENEPERIVEDRLAFEAFVEAVKVLTNQPNIVLLSSGGAVYGGDAEPPYLETSPTEPISSYGAAKLELERVLRSTGLKGVSVRASNAYGPGQPIAPGQGVIAHWLRAARRGEDLVLYGNPETARDFVYIDDLVSALLSLRDAPDPLPPVLNIGSGRPTTLIELARLVCAVVGYDESRITLTPPRSFDVSRTWLSIALARDCLGWAPETALEDGIQCAWEIVRTTGDPSA